MKSTHRLSVALLTLSVVACREMPTNDDVTTVDSSRPDTSTQPDRVVPGTDVMEPDATMMMGDGGVVPSTVTIRQLQDILDPAHPMVGARISIDQPGMIALTGRTLIGSSSAMDCRFGVWIGSATGGDHSAIQVQELITRGAASSCFNVMPRKIPMDIAPGTPVMAVSNATYSEFCAGPAGAPAGLCRDFEQSNVFLGGTATITAAGMGPAPTPTDITVAQIGQTMMNMPGPRALALEGTLVRVRNVRVTTTMTMSGMSTFTTVAINDPADATRKVNVLISNFPATGCARTHFTGLNGMMAPEITGILVPDFGVWSIRLRNEMDVMGLTCTAAPRDGGTTDASADASSRD
ncbi:MAG: hypothetical protein Q8Q09_08865 [Deltaproteobacteria bacterium]|nr:hypothetical protein [Deltaproteobacteria bacterium]